MGRIVKSKVLRVDINLDSVIREVAAKNNIEFTEASREIARAFKELKGKKIAREIRF